MCCAYMSEFLSHLFRAINEENEEANNVRNQLTGEFGSVPDTARDYKVSDIL